MGRRGVALKHYAACHRISLPCTYSYDSLGLRLWPARRWRVEALRLWPARWVEALRGGVTTQRAGCEAFL